MTAHGRNTKANRAKHIAIVFFHRQSQLILALAQLAHLGHKLDTGSGIRQHVGEQGDIVRQEIAKSPLDIAEGWSTYILSARQLLIAGISFYC